MDTYDAIMLLVLAVATVFGARKGLAWQVASVSSIIASYFIAYQFREPVAQAIDAEPPWNQFLAMLIVYLSSSLAIWTAFRFVSELIERVKLKEFDRHAGAAVGFCRGVLWCVIITLFAVTLLGEAQRQKIIQSRSGHYIALLLDRSETVMPAELHGVLAPYLGSLEARLGRAPETTFGDREGERSEGIFSGDSAERFPAAGILNSAGGRVGQEGQSGDDAVGSWLRRFQDSQSGQTQ
jgi:membrane protein required for colicin V production